MFGSAPQVGAAPGSLFPAPAFQAATPGAVPGMGQTPGQPGALAFGAALGGGQPGAAPTPTFGAAPSTASQPQFGLGTFGAASSAPSLFGGSSLAPLSTPSFSFPSMAGGAPTAVAPSPSPLGGSLMPSTTPSLFGASTPAAQPGAFGAPMGQQANTGAIPGFPPFATDTGNAASSQVASDLQALQAAFEPRAANPSYRFRNLFVNVVTTDQNVSVAAKPQNVDLVQWQEALDEVESLDATTSSNRLANEKLWPVGAGYGETSGFQDLIDRANAQEMEIAKQREFLDRVQATIASITRKHDVEIRKAVNNCRQKYEEQRHRLIHVMRFADFLEHRTFRHPFTSAEDDLAKQIGHLKSALQSGRVAPSSSTSKPHQHSADLQGLSSLPKRIEALAAYGREKQAHKKKTAAALAPHNASSSLGASGTASGAVVPGFTPENADKIRETLSKYLDALNKIQAGLNRDVLHLQIVEKHSKE